jgi:hypothetical protein
MPEKHIDDMHLPRAWQHDNFRVVTDSKGVAVFRDVPAGHSVDYTIDDDRYLPTSRYQDNPPVSGTTDYPTLHLIAAATVEGDLALNGKPLAGVRVQVNFAGELMCRSGDSDAKGHYRVTRIPYGVCHVHYFEQPAAPIPGGWVATQHNGINLTAGEHLTGIDFDFERGGIVKGTIVDENGKPQQLGVSATSPSFVPFQNGIASNPSDFFSRNDTPIGTYQIRLPAGRYLLRLGIGPNPPEQWVDIAAGETKRVDFQVDIKSRTQVIGGSMCGKEEDD